MGKEHTDVAALNPEKRGGEPAGAPAATVSGPANPAPRRAPGQKEIIPFVWKVCGYSFDGHTLTLFKSVDKSDAEAQLARLEKEEYYEGLRIYGIDEKVPQSPLATKLQAKEAARARRSKKAKKRAAIAKASGKKSRSSKAASKATSSGTRAARARKRTTASVSKRRTVKSSKKRPATKKRAAKALPKKKTSSAKRAGKPTARGKATKKTASRKKTSSKRK